MITRSPPSSFSDSFSFAQIGSQLPACNNFSKRRRDPIRKIAGPKQMTRIQMETIFNVDSMNQEHSSDVRSISNNKIYHSEYTETWLKIINNL